MGWAGPYAGRLLADMGAEVIKIEAVKGWDPLRSSTIQPPETKRPWDRAPSFNHLNRNKYGCVLDLANLGGREPFLRLVAVSDAVIWGDDEAALDRLGLDYRALSQANEQIIVVSLSGHGQTGLGAEQTSGLSHLTGYAGGPPQRIGMRYGDPMGGMAAAGAIILALWDRRRTGCGQRIEVHGRENLIGVIGENVVGYSMNGREPFRRGNRHPSMAPHGCYPCAGDDQWVAIACEDDAQFAALCAVIGQPDLASDPRFADVVSRYRHQDTLDGIVAAWSRERAKEGVATALQGAGVPAMPVLNVPEVFADEQLRARGFFENVSHAVAETWEMEGPYWRMSESPGHVRLPAPSFGEHNDYVFRYLLGLSEDEVASLKAAGVTGRVPDWPAQV